MKTELRPAIFLDRDGVINEDTNHVHKIHEFKLRHGTIEGLKKLSKQYFLFIVTNQSGIGKKIFTQDDYNILTDHMLATFKENDILIEKIYCCTHDVDDKCICRKPNPSSLFHAKEHHNIDLNNSWVIGDRWSDIKLGHNAGCRTILVEGLAYQKESVIPDFYAKDLLDAANIIIKSHK